MRRQNRTRAPRAAWWAARSLALGLGLGAAAAPAHASEAGRDYVAFISAGATHVAVVQPDDDIVSWGTDSHGELGDGQTTTKKIPVCAGGCTNDGTWTQVAAGTQFTLARRTDGSVWAWGSSNLNRNGAGSSADITTPQEVAELGTEWKAAAAGATHGFIISVDGNMWGWGDNAQGELGNNSTSSPGYFEQVSTPSGKQWIAAAPGNQYTLALRADGTLWGWGLNSSGQLGNGNTTRQLVPAQVWPASTVPWTFFSSGTAHSAGITADGKLYLWGSNDKGQLGNNTTATTPTSTPIPLTSTAGPWIAVSAGGHHTMAIKADGSLWAWGDNTYGQLGIGSTSPALQATQVGTLRTWQYVSAGPDYTVAVSAAGDVYTWGRGGSGQMGDNTTANRTAPAVSPTLVGVKPGLMVGGAWHGGAIRASGVMETNGDDAYGQLGIGVVDGTAFKYNEPQTVYPSTKLPWRHMAAGASQTLGVMANGTLWAWGGNGHGEVGKGNTTLYSSPTQVGSGKTWVKVYASMSSSYGITADGKLYAWGANGTGQLGDGTSVDKHSPTPIGTSAQYWVALAPGYYHTLGITADGKLWAWGDNTYGELGDNGAEASQLTPKQIGTLTNWIGIASGISTSTGILADGSLLGWGYGGQYAVGDGTNTTRKGPTSIGWGAIRTCRTDYSAVALTVDGRLLGWGYNSKGELGNSSFSTVTSPTENPNDSWLVGTKDVACGDSASYFWATRGGEFGMGDNTRGALGIQAEGGDLRNLPSELDRFIYPEPIEVNPTFSASVSASGHAASGGSYHDDGLYWSSGVAQASGQWYQVGFDETTRFSQIQIKAATSSTYPRNYQIFVSMDGVSWGSAIATGVGTQQTVPISFPVQNANYVRVVLNGASTSQWTIDYIDIMY